VRTERRTSTPRSSTRTRTPRPDAVVRNRPQNQSTDETNATRGDLAKPNSLLDLAENFTQSVARTITPPAGPMVVRWILLSVRRIHPAFFWPTFSRPRPVSPQPLLSIHHPTTFPARNGESRESITSSTTDGSGSPPDEDIGKRTGKIKNRRPEWEHAVHGPHLVPSALQTTHSGRRKPIRRREIVTTHRARAGPGARRSS